MQIAMTVGATKIQIIQESTLAAMEQQETARRPDNNSGCEP